MRHAKSSWENSRLADHDRPLNSRGKRDAPRVGRLLLTEELAPDEIITSSAARAVATAEAVALACDFQGEVRATRQLYQAGPEDYRAVLRAAQETSQRVLLVGHNPDLEELLAELSGVAEAMPTAAVAQIELNISAWSEVKSATRGVLKNLWRPKEL